MSKRKQPGGVESTASKKTHSIIWHPVHVTAKMPTALQVYRAAAPNETIPAALLTAIGSNPLVTAKTVKYEKQRGQFNQFMLECDRRPVIKVDGEGGWLIERTVIAYAGKPLQNPPQKLLLRHMNRDAAQEIPGGLLRRNSDIVVLSKCLFGWQHIRQVAPKLGKMSLYFKDLWGTSQAKHYAPGGAGYHAAKDRFDASRGNN